MKRDGLVITVGRRGTSSGIALRHPRHHYFLVQSAKYHTGRETAPRGVGFRGQTFKTIMTKGAWGPTQVPILITRKEPRVLITVGDQSVDFLLDIGATYSVLTEAPGPTSSGSASIMGLSG